MLQLLLNDPQLSGKQLANSIMVLLLCVFKVHMVYMQLCTFSLWFSREKWSGQLFATAMHMVK